MCLSLFARAEQKQPASPASRPKVDWANGAMIWATACAPWLIRTFLPSRYTAIGGAGGSGPKNEPLPMRRSLTICSRTGPCAMMVASRPIFTSQNVYVP
jgi:hypothetical protein